MKKPILVIAALALLLAAFSGAVFAQENEQNAKDLYLSYRRKPNQGRPGVKITIELRRDGETRTAPLNYLFRAGDKVKFHFETNFNAYVKVINLGSTGKPQLLYPYRGANDLVARTKGYAVPQGDLWFEFDQNPGVEQLVFVFSSHPFAAGAESNSAASRSSHDKVTPTSNGDGQQALADLSSRSLEYGKDFNLVQVSQGSEYCAYGVSAAQAVRKPIGVRIDLRHQ